MGPDVIFLRKNSPKSSAIIPYARNPFLLRFQVVRGLEEVCLWPFWENAMCCKNFLSLHNFTLDLKPTCGTSRYTNFSQLSSHSSLRHTSVLRLVRAANFPCEDTPVSRVANLKNYFHGHWHALHGDHGDDQFFTQVRDKQHYEQSLN